MNAKPSALGRGLGSLIPSKKSITEQVIPEAKNKQEILEIPLGQIKENPHQPRHHFAASDLEDLISSIKEHGILQPLVVTRQADGFELIAGERRFRSATSLGLPTVPAIVRQASDQEKLELALIENIQRQDLNAVEEAIAYKALAEEFGLTQDEVAKRVGKSRSTVANIIRLLELSEQMLMALKEGKITKSHARTLLVENDEKRREQLFKAMLTGEVTVREAEARTVSTHPKSKPTSSKDPNIVAHEKRLREILGTKVTIQEKGGKGRIQIDFYSKEELLDLLDRLSGY
ncbi:ParB/RepB/Spo0J family partition protein [Patescibacteria group bacterium]